MFPIAMESSEGDWVAGGCGGSLVGQDELKTLGSTGLLNHNQAMSLVSVPYAPLHEPGKG